MATKTSKKNNSTLNGTNSKDTLTVKHTKITVKALKGNDIININAGSSHKVYGGAGTDTFVISKKSTGKATVYDFANKEKLKVVGSAVKKITLSGKNLIFTGGTSGSITLNNAKGKSVTVTDSRGTYTVTASKITLGSAFTGTSFNASKYLATVASSTIDAKSAKKAVAITGNAKANTIYAAKAGGSISAGAGKDKLIVTGGNTHTLRGGTGTDAYEIQSKMVAATKITINQSDKASGDADTLKLTQVNRKDVSYDLLNGKMTIKHNTGGAITVTGWNKNPFNKITFKDGSLTGAAVTKQAVVTVVDASKTYTANSNGGIFQFNGSGWDAVLVGTNSKNRLDFSQYTDGDYGCSMSQADNNLVIKFSKYIGDVAHLVGTVTIKDYFVQTNKISQFTHYNFAEKKVETVNLLAGGNNNKGIAGTSGVDWIVTGNGNKTVNAGAGNDMIQVGWGDAGAEGTQTVNGGAGDDEIYADGGKNVLNGDDGNDIIFVENTNNNELNGGAGDDNLEVYGTGHKLNGGAGNDTIYIKGGSGHTVNSGTGNDKVYVTAGSAKSIVNSGGTDYIEIGKNAGNGIKVESVGSGTVGYGLVAKETVKVLGGNNHDIRLYGGNDKVVVAGGSGHVVYTDGPTGKGDAGGNDIIVIQDGGAAKKVVAGNGNDVIAVANGAGNNSTIYTGLEDPNGKNSGAGENTLNLLGGSGHTVYLGGTKNTVLVEAQDVTLNKYAGTVDDITVRWSEEGTGTLRINCPSVSSSAKSTLRLEGVNSFDFDFKFDYVDVKNANGVVSEKPKALIMEFGGDYTRDTRVVTIATRYVPDDAGNTNLPVYVNGNGVVQYNWCAGNEQFNYDKASVAGGAIEITRWDSMQPFTGITFDNGTYTQAQITTAANNHTKLW